MRRYASCGFLFTFEENWIMNNRATVVGLGEVLWDVFSDRKVLGGAPANFAYHMSQLGYDACVLSAVGDDLFGEEIIASLKETHLDFLIETTDFPTGTVQVTLDNYGIPQYDITENVAWDNIPFTVRTRELAKLTQVVSFGSLVQRTVPSRNTVRKFLSTMPENSLKIFDINLRQNYYSESLIINSLEVSNVLKINEEELNIVSNFFAYDNTEEQDVCRRLMEEFALQVVILTKGLAGSFVFTESETSFQSTPKVQVVDTVGAGDSFTAAFAASLLNGNSIAAAHKLAVDISSYVCTQRGAMPSLPNEYKDLFRKS